MKPANGRKGSPTMNRSWFPGAALRALLVAVLLPLAAAAEPLPLGADLHKGNGVSCADCHGKATKRTFVEAEKCLSCHGPATALAEKTAAVKPENPHASPHWGAQMECNVCHRQHEKPVDWCAHCHNYGALVYGSLAARLGTRAGVVYTIHGAQTSARRATRRFQRLRLVDRVVFVSADARSVAERAGAVSGRGVHTILNGVDVDALIRSGAGRLAVRREFGIDADAPVVGVVARLTRAKDHVTLFDAVAALRPAWPRLRCLVVGDGELREDLHRAASQRGLADVVVFSGSRSDIRDLLSAMDVFVLSSVTEGLAVTLLEAMSAGLPVVATRVGGNPEVVADGETGVLVQARAPEALAREVASLLADPGRAGALGEAAIARVRARFSLEAMVRSYEQVRHGDGA